MNIFFQNILGNKNDWSFLNNDRMKSYHICDISKLVVSSVSTLGYEAISRFSKVAIFNVFKIGPKIPPNRPKITPKPSQIRPKIFENFDVF